jgi:Do/DeqQ family serine protease
VLTYRKVRSAPILQICPVFATVPAYIFGMKRIPAILILALSLIASLPAWAETVPESRQQIILSFAPVVKKVSPAVVNVFTKRTITRQAYGNPFMDDPFFQQFFGNNFGIMPQPEDGSGLTKKQVEGALGSGVIMQADGLIVTNSHVIKGADQISVVLNDGREFEARVSLMDEPSDLAILRIDAKGAKLPFASLKPSEGTEVGDLVLAIGNPFGVGQTVTSGIISAQARSALNINNYNFFIQTDAAVNPGNSGGPLVDMSGAVIGINTAIYSRSGGSLGIGFAIPSEMVASVIAAEAGGHTPSTGIVRPWLGVTSQTVTNEMVESLGLPAPAGALISRLHPASPLIKAGVQVGDVIVSMNGKPVHDAAEIKFRMATVKMGVSADIGVFRKGKTFDAKVVAVAPPDNPPRNETALSTGLFDGATVVNINPAVATEMQNINQNDEGVVITKVNPRSTAVRFLAPGDIVVRVNRVTIKNVTDLKKALTQNTGALDLLINRGGQMQQIVIR